MTTPEGKVKTEIKAYLNSLGDDCWYFMPMSMGYGRNGIPDIVGCYKRRMFAIEVKAPGKERMATTWQNKEITAINTAGGMAIVCSNAITLSLLFKQWCEM